MWYDYKLIIEEGRTKFAAAVNEALAQGYTPMGGPVLHEYPSQFNTLPNRIEFIQAVAFWYEPEPDPAPDPE